MAKKLLASVLFLGIAVACVHSGRTPSSVEFPESTCQAAFETILDEMSVTSGRYANLTTIRKGYEYLQEVYPQEVFANVGGDKQSCERAREFSDIDKDLRLKIETVAQTGKMLLAKEKNLAGLAATTMFSDPEFERKAICVLNCGSNKSGKCADFCMVDQNFIDELAGNELFMGLYDACMPQEPEFRRWLEFHLPTWRKSLKMQLLPLYQELVMAAQSTRLALMDVRGRLKLEKQQEKLGVCDLPPPRWKNNARSMVDVVKGPKKQGTAFYISVGDEVRAVTADHIYNETNWLGENLPGVLTYSGRSYRRVRRSSITREVKHEAGLYSRGADIIQTRVPEIRPAFKLAASGAVPKDGQVFYLAGYPKVKDYVFTIYRCSFYGYSRSKISGSGSMIYVLRCPGVDGHIAGMSGGPVLDESGKVWGLITDHNPFLARVFVTPMSALGSEVRMGIQHSVMSEHCVDENEVEPKPCQVTPNDSRRTRPD